MREAAASSLEPLRAASGEQLRRGWGPGAVRNAVGPTSNKMMKRPRPAGGAGGKRGEAAPPSVREWGWGPTSNKR